MAIKRIGINVTIQNDLSDYFEAFRLALKRPMTHAVSNLIVRYIQATDAKHFKDKRDSQKVKWPRLREYTQKERKREGYNPTHPILVRTGKLLRMATEGLTARIARGGQSMEVYAVPPNKK